MLIYSFFSSVFGEGDLERLCIVGLAAFITLLSVTYLLGIFIRTDEVCLTFVAVYIASACAISFIVSYEAKTWWILPLAFLVTGVLGLMLLGGVISANIKLYEETHPYAAWVEEIPEEVYGLFATFFFTGISTVLSLIASIAGVAIGKAKSSKTKAFS